MYKNKSIHR